VDAANSLCRDFPVRGEQASAQISRSLGGQNPDVIALCSSPTVTTQSPGFRGPVEAEAQRLRALPGVASVASAYDGVPGLVSRDGPVRSAASPAGCAWTKTGPCADQFPF
jgi:hypothetical protein